ncbi:50S ribosomal protein L25 [Desulfobulbus sp. US2]|uniref:Large ribosomal subunit protein bL25 n=1 Tax=Candidatus Electrothrix communis TaxID=1859133 RepID=A0A3S3U620_9BACT|nr:50S ribosomal protein L25 [Desulfobulbus sp. US4]MCW5208110.1 50S ribosomal protein L25 [Desulfobulbus sp. US2]MCW5214605.1 50S ribosomal protein L25 [Desulfobulbus sp. US5]RWX42913.1 large subunit ribosomal protein L25 [Candidatus Electrothrix communis]WLE99171.1 MAG: 50S ribosomal protein L25 [Candidatus Electrothrix communis]
MIQVDIPAAVRTVFGKGESRRLRMDKKTPAVVYSKGEEALALQFDEAALYKNLLFIHGRNAVVTLDVEGDSAGKRHVLVQEIQKDPVQEEVLHVDFLEIDLDSTRKFNVDLRLTGVAKGVDLGGELNVSKQSLVLQGRPLDIPDEIVVDITALERGGEGISCKDLAIPENVEMLENLEAVCAVVI